MEKRITKNLIDFIKIEEGVYLKAYKCPAGVWTIGIGSTFYEDGSKVKSGDVIDNKRAEKLLEKYLTDVSARVIKETVKVELTQGMFEALCSFIYNVGEGAFKSSTLLKLLNKSEYTNASKEFLKWNKLTKNGMKITSLGLTKRREREKRLFTS